MNKKPILIAALAVLFIAGGIFIYDKNKSIKNPAADIFSAPANMDGKYKDSFEKAAKILAEKKNDYDALLAVARIKNWSGDYSGAIEVYKKMENLKENDIIPYFNMGDTYNSLKDYDRSGEMYEKVIAINPKWVSAYKELFNLYRYALTHKYDDKIEDMLQSGLKISQDMGGAGYSDFYAMLGIYYQGKGDKAKAIESFEKALEIDPSNEGVKSELRELKG